MFKALFYGNYDIHQIDNMKHYLAKFLPPSTKIYDTINYETKLRNINSSYIFRAKNDLDSEINHVIVNNYQISVHDIKFILISNILELFWGNFFYYYLRTKKHLGNIDSSSKFIKNNVMVLYLLLISTLEFSLKVQNQLLK